jgi:hypothetical protein
VEGKGNSDVHIFVMFLEKQTPNCSARRGRSLVLVIQDNRHIFAFHSFSPFEAAPNELREMKKTRHLQVIKSSQLLLYLLTILLITAMYQHLKMIKCRLAMEKRQ